MPTDLLFVYGTLRRSAAHPIRSFLHGATFLGFGEFRGRLYDLGNYPGVVASDDPGDIVRGEVYELHDPAAMLAQLDRYEGCDASAPAPTEYMRAIVEIRLPPGGSVRAQIYLYQRPLNGIAQIKSGDYLSTREAT